MDERRISPIIKRNLKLDPKKPLAQGLLDAGAKATTDIGSKLVEMLVKLSTLFQELHIDRQDCWKKIKPAVPLACGIWIWRTC